VVAWQGLDVFHPMLMEFAQALDLGTNCNVAALQFERQTQAQPKPSFGRTSLPTVAPTGTGKASKAPEPFLNLSDR